MKSKVKIAERTNTGERLVEVDDDIFGIVAVTRSVDLFSTGLWRITHIESGYALGPNIRSKAKAVKLARLINGQCEHFEGLSKKRTTKRNREAGKLFKEFWLQVGLDPWWT